MKSQSLPDTPKTTTKQPLPAPPPPSENWSDDTRIQDMDYFVKMISGIKSKGVRPDLVGSIIAHYSSKWLPDLSSSPTTTILNHHKNTTTTTSTCHNSDDDRSSMSSSTSPESVTVSWMKKRFFVETLVRILPKENGAVPCNFLLRLLRIANMAGVDLTYCAELEGRIACQLDQAELKELLIPSFSHTCGTLLDVELVIRLVRRFLMTSSEEAGGGSGGASRKSSMAVMKVARLVDSYLAEAAVDSNLGLGEFIDLAGALPAHGRTGDDGLYRAIDTYLKAHPNVTKQERKLLFRLIDSRKLSAEASLHASQNDRLPVRAVIQVLFSGQSKLARQLDCSGPLGTAGVLQSSCSTTAMSLGLGPGLDQQLQARCLSKREAVITAQQAEIRKLKEDILGLQSQCNAMQGQIERMMDKRSNTKGFFKKWRKIGMIPSFRNHGNGGVVINHSGRSGNFHLSEEYYGRDQGEISVNDGFGLIGRQATSMEVTTKACKGRTTPNKYWRKSMS